MISLDQVRLLEQKVEGMLALFSRLKNEKSFLEKENSELKAELETLKAKCSRFEQDEAKLEQGILSVLNRLNDMEDTVQSVLDPAVTVSSKGGKSSGDIKHSETEDAAMNAEKAVSSESTGFVSDGSVDAHIRSSSAVTENPSGAQLDIF